MANGSTVTKIPSASSLEYKLLGRFYHLLFSESEPEFPGIADGIAAAVAQALGDFCLVHLRLAGGRIALAGCYHEDAEKLGQLLALFGQHDDIRAHGSIVDSVIASGKEVVSNGCRKPAAFLSDDYREAARALGVHSLVIVPLSHDGQPPVGTLSVCRHRTDRPFSDDDLDLMRAIAKHATVKLDTARLHDELRRANEQLTEANQQLRHAGAILETTDDAVLSKTLDGTITSWNPAATKLYGYSRREALGRSVMMLVPAARRREFHELMDRLRRGHHIEHLETRRVTKQGELIDVSLTISPIETDGVVTEASVVARDITQRKQAERERVHLLEQLEDAVRARDAFISIASHELRTPLSALRLQTQILQRDARRKTLDADEERTSSRIDAIERQVGRLTALVERLLDVSRMMEHSRGNLSLDLREIDLCELAVEVSDRFEEELRRCGSTLSLSAARPVIGLWDRDALDRLLSNLLSNAIKYGEGRPIDVTVEADGDVGRLVIRDQGIGIAAEDRSRIFRRFERSVSRRRFAGFGLGLWIVQQVITALGGRIHVESEPGQGSTFVVELPLRPT